MREIFAFRCLTFFLLLQVGYQTREIDPYDWRPALGHAPPSGDTFLNSLTDDSDDPLISIFGLETLQGLHVLKLQCSLNVSTIEMKFTERMAKLLNYHRSMEKLVSSPKFSEFSNEDRPTIEENFHRLLRHAETSRDQELHALILACEQEQGEWLQSKFISAVEYARGVFDRDPAHFSGIISKLETYKFKLQYHLWACDRQEKSVMLMYCYREELETLVHWVDDFIFVLHTRFLDSAITTSAPPKTTPPAPPTVTPSASHTATPSAPPTVTPSALPTTHHTATTEYYGDDEDYAASGVGSGSGMESGDSDDTRPVSMSSELPHDEVTQQTEVSVTRSQDGGTNTLLTSTETPSQAPSPEVVEEAQTNQKTKEMSGDHSSGVKTSSKKTSKSRVSGEVEVQDGEVEIRIDVDTGDKPPNSNNDKVFESVFLDPGSSATPTNHNGDGWSYNTYILLFFLLTLVAIATLFVIITVALVLMRRSQQRHKGGAAKEDPPILSDQDMLETMKKSGYVNPTYKFYAQS